MSKQVTTDTAQRKSLGVSTKTSSHHRITKKSPLGKRLAKKTHTRKASRSTKDFKAGAKEPCTSEEISTSSRNQNLRRNFEELSKQMKTNSDQFYLGNPRLLERNEDTRFKILNAKRSLKRKSKVDGSRLTDNGRGILESHETDTLHSEALKTSPSNFVKSKRRPQKLGRTFNAFKKENRSLDTRARKKTKLGKLQTPEQASTRTGKKSQLEKNKSVDKAKFYLPRNLKVFKSSKIGLMNFEKHKQARQRTIHGRSELKKVPFPTRKKKVKVNGSQDSFKTQDFIQKRFKPTRGGKSKAKLVVIKKKLEAKNSFLKARSLDKSRLGKDNGIGAFTFGK